LFLAFTCNLRVTFAQFQLSQWLRKKSVAFKIFLGQRDALGRIRSQWHRLKPIWFRRLSQWWCSGGMWGGPAAGRWLRSPGPPPGGRVRYGARRGGGGAAGRGPSSERSDRISALGRDAEHSVLRTYADAWLRGPGGPRYRRCSLSRPGTSKKISSQNHALKSFS